MGRPPRKFRPPYGDWLFTLRSRKGMSLSELAQETGISIQTLSNWERTGKMENRERIILLSKALGVSCSVLLAASPQPPLTFSEKLTVIKTKQGLRNKPLLDMPIGCAYNPHQPPIPKLPKEKKPPEES